MDFDLSRDQREIKDVARELLTARSPFAKVREAAEAGEYDAALWSELVKLGWPGIAVAQEHGGQGLGAVELAVLAEELGYACAATPFLSTAAAAAAIQAAGTEEQRARWLPGLVSGELTGGIGTRELAVDAAGAAVAVVLDGDDAQLIELPETDAFVSIDPTRRYATVAGEGAPLGPGAADRIRAAVAGEVVGVCQRALDMTLAYVKERRQFGVPVGSFQAVAHRCAEMLLHTESARSTAYYAAWAAGADPQLLPEAAALAGAAAAEAGQSVTAAAIQMHGGIGFTWEADVHWLYKRAQLDATLLGGARRHRAALARQAAAKVRQKVGG
ncbi:MAG TPA: acyl-CoA dehydrogenase family protein [Solirubrobacteraceae bacterium]|jgi:alkylation response protein AidB-like acyl-CoA dehydrogenase|nr:acyl-CoA dehydrogenase family protein [Solirubrobacteraceae bacterium]